MKRIFPFLVLLFSCGDGDLEIETIDFDDISLQLCEDPIVNMTNIFFKIDDDEALILELESGALNNGVAGETVLTTSNVPSGSRLTYRIFSETVGSDYFCDDIPPTTPIVIEEIEANDGIVTISTTVKDDDDTLFEHTITFSEISFVNNQGERITDLTVNDFGEVTTPVPSEEN